MVLSLSLYRRGNAQQTFVQKDVNVNISPQVMHTCYCWKLKLVIARKHLQGHEREI